MIISLFKTAITSLAKYKNCVFIYGTNFQIMPWELHKVQPQGQHFESKSFIVRAIYSILHFREKKRNIE